MQFSDSEGRKNMEIHRQIASWVNATGTLDGKPAGIAIIALETPFGEQSSWFLVAILKIPGSGI